MSTIHAWKSGDILYAADLDGAFAQVESDIAAAAATATAAATAAAAAIPETALGVSVATLVNGQIPASQLPAVTATPAPTSSSGVTSFAGRTGVVVPDNSDYALGGRAIIGKPNFSSFTSQYKSTKNPPTVAALVDGGNCMVLSHCGPVNNSWPNTSYIAAKAYNAATDVWTVLLELDDVSTAFSNSGSPAFEFAGIGLVDTTSFSSPYLLATSTFHRNGNGQALTIVHANGLYAGTTSPADAGLGNNQNQSPQFTATYASAPAVLKTQRNRIWARVSGLTKLSATTPATISVSQDGLVWVTAGTLLAAAGKGNGFATVNQLAVFVASYPQGTGSGYYQVPYNLKIIGWEELDVNGNLLAN